MKKTTCYFLIILFVLLPFIGCKKEQAVQKPIAIQVQPPMTTKEVKEPEDTKRVEQEVYMYDPKGKRDPFLSLVMALKKRPERKKGVSPFESYSVDEISLLAIAWDNQKHYALIMLPDKKSYTITEGMTLGLNGGKVQKITNDKVMIREYVRDYKGNLKPKDSILRLRKEEVE
jgi:type IV pilus assembly protein PilP